MNGKYILYAEDDLDDQELLTDMLTEADDSLKLICLNNGSDLLNFLDSLTPGSPYPCMIILDINMPTLDGLQTLKQLRKNPRFRELPVVMFSTSSSQADIHNALKLGADEFITKPVKPDQLQDVANRFASYCRLVP